MIGADVGGSRTAARRAITIPMWPGRARPRPKCPPPQPDAGEKVAEDAKGRPQAENRMAKSSRFRAALTHEAAARRKQEQEAEGSRVQKICCGTMFRLADDRNGDGQGPADEDRKSRSVRR